jgi:hypothetical protein
MSQTQYVMDKIFAGYNAAREFVTNPTTQAKAGAFFARVGKQLPSAVVAGQCMAFAVAQAQIFTALALAVTERIAGEALQGRVKSWNSTTHSSRTILISMLANGIFIATQTQPLLIAYSVATLLYQAHSLRNNFLAAKAATGAPNTGTEGAAGKAMAEQNTPPDPEGASRAPNTSTEGTDSTKADQNPPPGSEGASPACTSSSARKVRKKKKKTDDTVRLEGAEPTDPKVLSQRLLGQVLRTSGPATESQREMLGFCLAFNSLLNTPLTREDLEQLVLGKKVLTVSDFIEFQTDEEKVELMSRQIEVWNWGIELLKTYDPRTEDWNNATQVQLGMLNGLQEIWKNNDHWQMLFLSCVCIDRIGEPPGGFPYFKREIDLSMITPPYQLNSDYARTKAINKRLDGLKNWKCSPMLKGLISELISLHLPLVKVYEPQQPALVTAIEPDQRDQPEQLGEDVDLGSGFGTVKVDSNAVLERLSALASASSIAAPDEGDGLDSGSGTVKVDKSAVLKRLSALATQKRLSAFASQKRSAFASQKRSALASASSIAAPVRPPEENKYRALLEGTSFVQPSQEETELAKAQMSMVAKFLSMMKQEQDTYVDDYKCQLIIEHINLMWLVIEFQVSVWRNNSYPLELAREIQRLDFAMQAAKGWYSGTKITNLNNCLKEPVSLRTNLDLRLRDRSEWVTSFPKPTPPPSSSEESSELSSGSDS